MRRWLPYPWLWLALLALWLLLNQSLWLGHLLLGGVLAWVACLAYARLETAAPPAARSAGAGRRLRVAVELLLLVIGDMLRSNLEVARIVLGRATPQRTSGFVDIPLALRDRFGLALLACIITATPGTAWVRFDPARGLLTMHVLDLVDDATWIDTIKNRYERRLQEIFE